MDITPHGLVQSATLGHPLFLRTETWWQAISHPMLYLEQLLTLCIALKPPHCQPHAAEPQRG